MHRLFNQSRLLRHSYSTLLYGVLLGVHGPLCVVIGVGSFLFRFVCLKFFSFMHSCVGFVFSHLWDCILYKVYCIMMDEMPPIISSVFIID